MSMLAVVMTWPALRQPTLTFPARSIDPPMLAWAIAWSGHGLVHAPLHVFDGNTFYPAPHSLAFTDSMLGYGPISWLGRGPGHVLADYNIIFVATSALAGVAGYALARQLGANRIGAAVAGLGLAYAPWRAGQAAHLHVLSTGPFIAALAMLARGHGLSLRGRKGPLRPWWALAGWLAAAGQISIGFEVGLPFAYLMAVIALIAAVAWLARLRQEPPRLPWRLVLADLAGAGLFAAAVAVMAQPYFEVAAAQAAALQATRNLQIVAETSPTWRGLLAPPHVDGTWSVLNNHLFADYGVSGELRLLPGFTLIALALLGLFFSAWRLRWRLALAAEVAVMSALALGTHLAGHGEAGFVFLWRHAPGFAADRTPGRLDIFSTVGLALLAAGAVTRLAEGRAANPGGTRAKARVIRLALLALLPVLVVAEGYARIPESRLPPVPAALRSAPAPVVVLPSVWTFDSTVMAWSAMAGFPKIANGMSGITPSSLKVMHYAMAGFPDARSVAYLRSHGFNSVVVLTNQAHVPSWANAGQAPAPALGLRRINMGDSVLFLVEPTGKERNHMPGDVGVAPRPNGLSPPTYK